MKRKHTVNVCEVARLLATALGLSSSDRFVIDAAALLHDIGRFEQYTRFGTFDDAQSFDHALYGAEIVRRHGVLDSMKKEDVSAILFAVEHHSALSLPAASGRWDNLAATIVRDADQIDIVRLSIESFDKIAAGSLPWEQDGGLSRWRRISPPVVEALLSGERIPFAMLDTVYDECVLYLSWINTLNHRASVELVERRGYVGSLLAVLPAGPERYCIKAKVVGDLADRLGRRDDFCVDRNAGI